MSDGLEDAYLHNTVEAASELIDTYDQIKGYVFHIENIVLENSDATSS